MRTEPVVLVLDQEWLELIKQAKEIGLSKEEIQNFLREANQIQHLSQ